MRKEKIGAVAVEGGQTEPKLARPWAIRRAGGELSCHEDRAVP